MATYLPNITDTNQETAFYQPDYSFLQQTMQKANQQFEQQIGQIKSEYGNILNQQVTGDKANEVKKGYIQRAQQGLKKIAAQDLTLPQSVQQAESLFAPFWQDDMLLMNISGTKNNTNAEQQYYADYNSSDKEKRALANNTALEAIQWDKKRLADLDWSKEAYSGYNPMGYVPVYDTNGNALTMAGKIAKDGVQSVDENGAAKIVKVNGPQSRDAYTTLWLAANSDPKYDKQYRMYAYVDANRKLADIKKTNPGIDEQTANNMLGQEYTEHKVKYYQDIIKNHVNTASEYKAKMDQLMKGDGDTLDESKAAEFKWYAQQYNNAMNQANGLETSYAKELGYTPNTDPNGLPGTGTLDKENEKYKNTLNNITLHPLDYLSDVLKWKQAQDWAAGPAAISSVDVKKSEPWEAVHNFIAKEQSLSLKAAGEAEKENYDKWKEFHMVAKIIGADAAAKQFGITDLSGYNNFIKSGGGSGDLGQIAIDPSSGRIMAQDVTNVIQAPKDVDTYRNAQNTLHNIMIESACGYGKGDEKGAPAGIAGIAFSKSILGDKGLDSNEAAYFYTWAKKSAAGVTSADVSPEEKAAADKVINILSSAGLVKEGETLTSSRMLPLITAYASKSIPLIKASTTHEDIDKIPTLAALATGIDKGLAQFNANEEQFQKQQKAVLANKEFDKISVPDGKEGKRFVEPEDVEHYFPDISGSDEQGILRHFSPKELADAYIHGKYVNHVDGVSVNGVDIHPYIVNGRNFYAENSEGNWYNPDQPFNDAMKTINTYLPKGESISLYDKFGTSDQHSALRSKASEQAVKGLISYNGGLIGPSVSYDIQDDKNKSQQATGIQLAKESVDPRNADMYYTKDDHGKVQQITGDEEKRIIQGLKDKEDLTKVIGSIDYIPIGTNGKPAIAINFKPTSDVEVGSKKASDLAKKGPLFIDIAKTATGDLLNAFPKQNMVYTYQGILDGKKVDSPEMLNSLGYKYTVVPMDVSMGKASRCRVSAQMEDYDPLTGETKYQTDNKTPKMIDITSPPINLLKGEQAHTPDEVMRMVNSSIDIYFKQRAAIQKAYADRKKAQGGGVLKSDLMKQIQF